MWLYEKNLEYPVKITKTCPKTAQLIISQYGGPDGELSASLRYLSQRYTMPVREVGGLLTDIGRGYGNGSLRQTHFIIFQNHSKDILKRFQP